MKLLRTLSAIAAVAATAGLAAAAEPDGSWITFLSRRSGGNALHRMHPDGSGIEPIFGGALEGMPGLSAGMTWVREPHWTRQSPDGRFFLSWAVDRGLPMERYRSAPRFMLHLGRTDGGPTRLITPDSEEVFCWSPDSRRFAYARTLIAHPMSLHHPMPPRSELVVAALDGSSEEVVLDRPGLWAPQDWSPDGKRLLVSYRSTIILQKATSALFELDLDAAREGVNRLRSAPRRPDPGGDDEAPEGGGLRAVLPLARAIGCGSARYSPDGKSIALIGSALVPPGDDLIDPARFASSFELRVHDLGGEKARVLCREPDIFGGPLCWSPDGSRVLFSRTGGPPKADRGEPGDQGMAVWSINRDGGGLRKLTTGWCPDWRGR